MDKEFLPSIGIFDSGVGGLSVLRCIRKQLLPVNIIYFADQEHVPYGTRSLSEVRDFSESISRFLLAERAKIIVVACNTASAAALQDLRNMFPDIPFVGVEPAVKPAVKHTRTGVIGVLATPATFQGILYTSVVNRFAKDVKIIKKTCPGLVDQIEKGELNSPKTRAILAEALLPMLNEKIDTVVLGCTHYPFVIPLIKQIVGPDVRVIDPAPAVARQVRRILTVKKICIKSSSNHLLVSLRFFTSGPKNPFKLLLPSLLGEKGPIQEVEWMDDRNIRLKKKTG